MKKRVNESMKLEKMHNLARHIPFALFAILGFVGNAQDSLNVEIDTNPVPLREFPKDLSRKYADKAFDYDVVEGEAENFLSRILRWFFETIADIFGFELSPELFTLIKILFYVALGVLVLYIAIKLLLGEGSASFFTRKDASVAPIQIKEEHIETIDLDAYIKDALAEKNYRLAIRYRFLQSLQRLSSKQLIDWHSDKTNSDYYHEIQDSTLKSNFKKITYLYDNVWYGEYLLDAAAYNKSTATFDQLNKLIGHAR